MTAAHGATDPDRRPRVLMVGRSHVAALQAAIDPRLEAEVVNLWMRHLRKPYKAGTLDLSWLAGRSFDLVCLASGVNLGNVMSLLDGPAPFAVVGAEGRVPAGPAGDGLPLVPRDMLRESMAMRFLPMDWAVDLCHRLAPDARFVHLAPPPPVRHLGPLETREPQLRMLDFTLPPDLRLELWRIEREMGLAACRRHGAEFHEPPPEAVDPDGFLWPRFHDADATHANAAYGRLALARIDHRLLASVGSSEGVPHD